METSFQKRLEEFKYTALGGIVDDSSEPRTILVAPANQLTSDGLNRILQLAGGLPFVALGSERVKEFQLQSMAGARKSPNLESLVLIERDDLVSVEARSGVTTGISIADRLQTIQILGEAHPDHRKLVSPGHIFPVATKPGGVLVKSALPEAALDLVKIAEWTDAALFVDLLNKQGDFYSSAELKSHLKQEKIPLFHLAEIIRFRLENEKLVVRVAESKLPTRLAGELRSYLYKSMLHNGEHLVLVKGEIDPSQPVLTRVQAEFTFGDVFGGSNPPTREILHNSLKTIAEHGSGVLLYLRRPFGGELSAQVKKWDKQYAQPPAAIMREYGLGAQILRDLGIQKIHLLTNSKNKLEGIRSFGIDIVSTQEIPF